MMHYAVTAGSSYLDIDAYACSVALAELLTRKGEKALAYSHAPCNYSVCPSLMKEGQLYKTLPAEYAGKETGYIIVDVSDPNHMKAAVPLEQVIELYDHHTGFEEYWEERIGNNAHIEFIGAAATLIFREWKKTGLENQMSRETARLLVAAILDNTLNLTSSNTTAEDVDAFRQLCLLAEVDESWCGGYFAEVQRNMEADLQQALLKDVKTIPHNPCLPSSFAQLGVWDAHSILKRLPELRQWLDDGRGPWLLNLMDIQHQCSYFVCEYPEYQRKLECLFDIQFENGVAKTRQPYLRKEIIRRTTK